MRKFRFLLLTKWKNYCIINGDKSRFLRRLHGRMEIIMKTAILLGDSIRMGYESAVKNSLQGIVDVYSPKDGNLYASHLFRFVHEQKNMVPGEVDVLHWNAGLWDVMRNLEEDPQTPIEIYKYYIERTCKRIVKAYPNTKVIFATTTSVQTEKMHKDCIRFNEDIELYNAAAVEIVKKYGFEVNDLNAVSKTLPEEAHSDPTHYGTSLGTEAFAKAVIKHITKALDIHQEIAYKE